MSLEIKELVVRFSVEDSTTDRNQSWNSNKHNSLDMKVVVDECVEKVLERIERLTER